MIDGEDEHVLAEQARRKFDILKLTRGSWQGRAQGLGAICPCFSGRVDSDGWWTANESEGQRTSLNIGGCVNHDHPNSVILSYMF